MQKFRTKNLKGMLVADDVRFGRILSFIDFGNVNHWFDDDVRDWNGNFLNKSSGLKIDLKKLFDFGNEFSSQARFYYGHDPQNEGSLKFIGKAKYVFGENSVFTKPIQRVRHYLKGAERRTATRKINSDGAGDFVYLPKCNFDVEICVDAIRLMNKYDTFCLFSGDADFVSLIKFLKNNRKKIILIKGGHIQYLLKISCDLVVNGQDIKERIAFIMQKSSRLG